MSNLTKTEIDVFLFSTPDDLRKLGWVVSHHSDNFDSAGELLVYWLLTKGRECVHGEGKTDLEALDQIRKQVGGVCRDCGNRIHPEVVYCASCGDQRGP